MSWTDSRVFTPWIVNPMAAAPANLPTGYNGLVADTVKAALYNGSITPDRTALVTNTGYNTGVWANTNEVTGASEWVAGGRQLTSTSWNNAGTNAYFFAANLAGSATLTMSGINGCLVYDASITGVTVANQGFCYNYFGGSLGVTSGTFSVNFNAFSGVAQFVT